MTDKQPDRAEREAFESWYNSYNPAHKSDKQRAKDAYDAALAAPQQAASNESAYQRGYMDGMAKARRDVTATQQAANAFFGLWLETSSEPAAPQQVAPSVDADRALFDAGWKACARFCDREDVSFDGIVGDTGCPEFEQAFDAARKEGK